MANSSAKTHRPTNGELAILRVLWNRGPSSVRQVHRVLYPDGQTTYNTTLKLMQIMLGKGLLARDDSERPQVYRSLLSENRTRRGLLLEMVDKAFDGSVQKLVMHALSARRSSPPELAEIRELLERLQGG